MHSIAGHAVKATIIDVIVALFITVFILLSVYLLFGARIDETISLINKVSIDLENKEIKELYAYFDFPALPEELKAEDIVKETRHDKKMEHGKIKFILLDKVGEAAIYQDVTPEEMLTVLERV